MNGREQLAAGATLALVNTDGAPVLVMTAADRIDSIRLRRLAASSVGPAVVVRADSEPAVDVGVAAGGALAGLRFGLPVDAAGVMFGWTLHARARTMRAVAAGTRLDVPGHVLTATVASGDAAAAGAAAWLAAEVGSAAVVVAAPAEAAASRAVAVPLAALSAERAAAEALAVRLPTPLGELRMVTQDGGLVALVHGDPAAAERTLVRHRRACLLGDALGSLGCDCRASLDAALRAVCAAPAGVLLYARGPGALFPRDHGRPVVDGVRAAALLRGLGARAAAVMPEDEALAAALSTHGVEVHADVSA